MFSRITYSNGFLQDETTAEDPYNDRPKKRLACLECRARKVKCSGEDTGCIKCIENKITCTYPESSRRGGPKRKRSDAPKSRDSQSHSGARSKSASTASSNTDNPIPSYSSASLSDDSSLFNFNPNAPFMPSTSMGDEFSLDIDPLSTDYLKDGPGDYGSMDLGVTTSQCWTPLHSTKATSIGRSSSPRDDECSCAQSAAQMLSYIDFKIATIGDLSVDAILAYQNCAMAQLNYWLVCEHCDSPRATTKLIILVVEGLCLCMETAVAGYVSQVQAGMSEESQFPMVSCNIGKYNVSTWNESKHILRVSLLCRCSDLQAAVVSLQERDVLGYMLKEAEQKLANMINQLKRCESYI